jgi:hypothetical protein
MMDIFEQHRKNATIETHWLDDAKRDLKYNRTREEQENTLGNTARAEFYKEEADLDEKFIPIRQEKIEREESEADPIRRNIFGYGIQDNPICVKCNPLFERPGNQPENKLSTYLKDQFSMGVFGKRKD